MLRTETFPHTQYLWCWNWEKSQANRDKLAIPRLAPWAAQWVFKGPRSSLYFPMACFSKTNVPYDSSILEHHPIEQQKQSYSPILISLYEGPIPQKSFSDFSPISLARIGSITLTRIGLIHQATFKAGLSQLSLNLLEPNQGVREETRKELIVNTAHILWWGIQHWMCPFRIQSERQPH